MQMLRALPPSGCAVAWHVDRTSAWPIFVQTAPRALHGAAILLAMNTSMLVQQIAEALA
jgi:hypothetical protein